MMRPPPPSTHKPQWPMENGQWKMANGKWPRANAQWKMANGKWPMENGQWEMANGQCPRGLPARLRNLLSGAARGPQAALRIDLLCDRFQTSPRAVKRAVQQLRHAGIVIGCTRVSRGPRQPAGYWWPTNNPEIRLALRPWAAQLFTMLRDWHILKRHLPHLLEPVQENFPFEEDRKELHQWLDRK